MESSKVGRVIIIKNNRVRQRLGLAADAEPDIKEFTDEELTDYADWYNNTLLSHAHERTL